VTHPTNLVPATKRVLRNRMRLPNASDAYRRARNALLAAEIKLRRHIEKVAEQRQATPPGGEVTGNYHFQGEHGPVDFAGLFGDKPTLVVYSFMFGPQRERPCPMCTSLLSAWDGEARDIGQRVALAVVARSPIERLIAFRNQRGWRELRLYANVDGTYSRDYFAIDSGGGDDAALNVFTRRDGSIRHFWSGEMGFETADPGQDPRGAPDLMPLWTILDMTPAGRGTDWYPTLDYND
jgi:predicted dithiol-disulfide oxidoreductase (DUF899 family)